MLCQDCKQHEAEVHYFESVNGKRTTKDICYRCADKLEINVEPGKTTVMEEILPPHSDEPLKYVAPSGIDDDGIMMFSKKKQ